MTIILCLLIFVPGAFAEYASSQLKALEWTLHWIQNPRLGKGRLPQVKDFSRRSLPIVYAKVVSQGHYKPEGRCTSKGMFASPEEFWMALYSYAKERGYKLRLLDLQFHHQSAKFREIVREEALQLVFLWIKQNRRLPKACDFGHQPDQIPISYHRLTSQGAYTPGKRTDAGIFPSSQDFWCRLHVFAAERETALSPLAK